MQHRILRYHVNEIAIDHEAVADSLNQACRRGSGNLRVSGIFQANGEVVFALEDNDTTEHLEYVIAPFMGDSVEDVIADICSRWGSGFATRGLIELADSRLGLFEQPVRQLRRTPVTP